MMRNTSSIKTKALNLLARREYTRAELEKKLLAWARNLSRQQQTAKITQGECLSEYSSFDENIEQYDDESTRESNASSMAQEICHVLDALQTRGLLSDERALESLLNQKAHRFGGNRLKQDMLAKGFDTSIIQTTLEELKDTEFDRALTTWQRKFSAPPLDAASYNKQARFLSYRGFSAEIVRKVLEQVRRGDFCTENFVL